jgi:hypothetical protein
MIRVPFLVLVAAQFRYGSVYHYTKYMADVLVSDGNENDLRIFYLFCL